MRVLAADYAKLVTRCGPLAEIEQAFHEAMPVRVVERYGMLVTAGRLEAWKTAAASEGIEV